jgi:hypothetical protein
VPGNAVESWVTHPENDFVAPSHRGALNCIAVDGTGLILSAGEDGSVVIWDGEARAARERFQLSRYPLEKLAVRPASSEAVVYESDGIDFYRVSVWDYAKKERRFTLPVTNPVLYCGYTAQGKYLVLSSPDGLLIFDSETGERRGEMPGGYAVTFAVSNRTETTLQTYSSLGVLAYWDLDGSRLLQSFTVPANLSTPLVFGNYRFLAGQDGSRLLLIDAVSGKIFFETQAVADSVLFRAGDTSFFRVSYIYGKEDGGGVLKRELFTVNATGSVERGETLVRMNAVLSTTAPLDGRQFLGGSDDGLLAIAVDDADEALFFSFKNQRRLLDAAASPGLIAFTDEKGCGAFIPDDFNSLSSSDSITLFGTNSSNRVTSDGGGSFLFWHYGEWETSTMPPERTFPFVKIPEGPPGAGYLFNASNSPGPLRNAAIDGGKVLFLDLSGGINVFSSKDGRRLFSYNSALLLDAVFIDGRNILVARNAEAGRNSSPFLLADTLTGETLPAAYPAPIAFTLYKNPPGNIYAAVLKTNGPDLSTQVIRFNRQKPYASDTILEYRGEDTDFLFIEYGATGEDGLAARFASTAGSEEAFIVPDGDVESGVKKVIDRVPAFPRKLLPCNGNFAALDDDGTVSWYDGASGKLLAMLRFYETEWLLSGADGTTKRGSLKVPDSF